MHVCIPLSARTIDTNKFEKSWAFEMFECRLRGGGGGVKKNNTF